MGIRIPDGKLAIHQRYGKLRLPAVRNNTIKGNHSRSQGDPALRRFNPGPAACQRLAVQLARQAATVVVVVVVVVVAIAIAQ